ncbi:MAG: endonuclease IV [Clostridiales bacterium]|nr:endonuclease IV [Clostridiales bacterium]
MLRFGPAGNSESFYEAGYKSTLDQPKWLSEMGLNAYEYSFGRGVRLKEETAKSYGAEFARYGIMPSCHAPYYINMATEDPIKRENNLRYLREAAQRCIWLGGNRVIFHPGVEGKDRTGAVQRIKEGILEALNHLDELGLGEVTLCPETMGKISQIGNLEETLEFCTLDERLIPCIDFGHLYARSLGADEGDEATEAIIKRMMDVIGLERTKKMHVHFSNIEYTKAGERRHHNYGASPYGPDFTPLARQIVKWGLEPTVICESAGKMAEDAKLFLEIHQKIKEEFR